MKGLACKYTDGDSEADTQTDFSTERKKRQADVQSAAPMKPVKSSKSEALVCADCGAGIGAKVRNYSQKQFGRPLCIRCQHDAINIA